MKPNRRIHAVEAEETAVEVLPEPSPAAAGRDVIREREQLDETQPELAWSYKRFLESFSLYRQVEKQFTRPSPTPPAWRPAAPDRFK